MNAAFTYQHFLRMVHACVDLPGFGSFKDKVSLTFAAAHRCPMI
jgi:hypothetical protein